MKVAFDPAFYTQLKKIDVRIRNALKQKILIFSKNHLDPKLNNHPLKREYKGYRSVDITADYRALYKVIKQGNETVAYFVLLGTHEELYR